MPINTRWTSTRRRSSIARDIHTGRILIVHGRALLHEGSGGLYIAADPSERERRLARQEKGRMRVR